MFRATTNYRINEHKILKIEHEQVILDLQKLPKEISEALVKYKELTKNTNSYK